MHYDTKFATKTRQALPRKQRRETHHIKIVSNYKVREIN